MNEDFEETPPEGEETAQPPQATVQFDEVLGAAHFDAAYTASQSRFSGVYNDGPHEPAPEDTDPSRGTGDRPDIWGY